MKDHCPAQAGKQYCKAWAGEESNGHPGSEQWQHSYLGFGKQRAAMLEVWETVAEGSTLSEEWASTCVIGHVLVFVHKFISDGLNYTTSDNPHSPEAFIFFLKPTYQWFPKLGNNEMSAGFSCRCGSKG